MNIQQILLLLTLVCSACGHPGRDKLIFPYSQWTVGPGSGNVSWHYREVPEFNDSFIKGPEEGEWEEWYEQILDYRRYVREMAGKDEPFLVCDFPGRGRTVVHFDKFAYQLKLSPGEEIEISGESRSAEEAFSIRVDYDLKTRGQELSYVVRKRMPGTDSLLIRASGNWKPFSMKIRVPHFNPDSFSIVPVLRLEPTLPNSSVLLRNIELGVNGNRERKEILSRINSYIDRHSGNSTFKIPEELEWTHRNFVMGFVFIWDSKFWNPVKKEYTVDRYCREMEEEFGGMQSVVLWHSYPNIGVDERNQFGMLQLMPYGMQGLKQVVDDFHRNGVKVFLTYNPWDLDTDRPEKNDFEMLADVLTESGADGVYLDTWKCSKGIISLFEFENSIRDEVKKRGKSLAFTTEIMPELKDLTGPDALTSSWGQEIHPFHYTDLSHIKWLLPEHKQYYIQRMAREKKPLLAHAWINGQGIQVWENIFGTMNLWTADQRQVLRKMNAIWKYYGNFLITDNWKPLMPTMNRDIIASTWTVGNQSITHFVDTLNSSNQLKFRVTGKESRCFDLWKGVELQPFQENGDFFVEMEIQDFGCLLQCPSQSDSLSQLLQIQKEENTKTLPVNDPWAKELSMEEEVKYKYSKSSRGSFISGLLKVQGMEKTFTSRHIWREGECYPDRGAGNNHLLRIDRDRGYPVVVHTHTEKAGNFSIMPRVVSNRQFEEFLNAAEYSPDITENFLRHWGGNSCPEEIKDDPVVFVSLEDARAFAEWAGMELPSEWEWQLAVETCGDAFRLNEVFEWNESERTDGFNRSVSLRGGCSRWKTSSSWWYFPGAPYGSPAGGEQAYDSHVKYFLMYPGADRASTIGFRCLKR